MTKPPHRSEDFLAFMARRQADQTYSPRNEAAKAVVKTVPPLDIKIMRVKDVVAFIKAREHARQTHDLRGQISEREMTKRVAATDPIIQTYRFCNMRREDDRVTRWLTSNWRIPYDHDHDLWFAMAVARLALNSVDSMDMLGYPVPWRPKKFMDMVSRRQKAGMKIYGPAYMIATPNWTGPKHQFLVDRLLTPLWNQRHQLRPLSSDTLASFHGRLVSVLNVGSFGAGQVVADIKYVAPLMHATDWWTWAAPGPGSRRGLNRVIGRDKDTPWSAAVWLQTLQALLKEVNKSFPGALFHAQDMQNVMCEFDKYERARLGEGSPKQLYVPHKEPM